VRYNSPPDLGPELHLRDVGDPYRHAIDRFQGEVADVIEAREESYATDEVFLGPEHQELSSRVSVVLVDGIDDVLERYVVLQKRVRTRLDLILEDVPAHREHLSDSGNGS